MPLISYSALILVCRDARLFLQRQFMCSRGCHDNRPMAPGEEPTNFCHACGALVNPKAFGVWEVRLCDGTTMEVVAINIHHAKSLVTYGEDLSGRIARMRRGDFKTHPQNIIAARRLRDANLQFVPTTGESGSPLS